MKKWLGSGMLLLTAVIWGVAFVAQSVGMDYVEPFTFNFARYIIGAVVLLPFLGLGNAGNKKAESVTVKETQEKKKRIRKSVLCGIICGFLLFIASMLQQFGIIF